MPSGNKELDQELNNLLNIETGNHSDSKKYTKMMTAFDLLSEGINRHYPKNDEEPKNLSEEELTHIKSLYAEAIKRCKDYMYWKGDSRSSGYGQARLKTVNAIKKILEKDLKILQNADLEIPPANLPSFLSQSRVTEAKLDVEEKDLFLVGDNSSERIPLAVNIDSGIAEGFFTQDFIIEPYEVIDFKIRQKYENNEDLSEILQTFHDRLCSDDDYTRDNHITLYTDAVRDLKKYDIDRMLRTGEGFEDCFAPIFHAVYGNNIEIRMDAFRFDRKSLSEFLDFVQEAGGMLDRNVCNNEFGYLNFGQNVPNRNVAFYRFAGLLGAEDLVAPARRMKLTDKEGNVRYGIFQERARGSELFNIRENDPLLQIKNNPDMINNPNVIKKIADMQLLGYLFGSTDMHMGNVVVQTKKVEGVDQITGFKLIDNDRSGGTIDKEDATMEDGYFICPPEYMKIITADMASKLKEITKAKLEIAFKDLNMDDESINACITRLNDVKQAIKDGIIKVVEDKDLAGKKISDYKTDWKDKTGGDRRNIFSLFNRAAQAVKHRNPRNHKDIKYNKATAVEKKYEKTDELDVYLSDLKKDRDFLSDIKAQFKATDIMLHKNGGGYNWMYESLKSVIFKINEFETKYGENDIISKDDAKNINKLYNELRRASKDYAETHPTPGHNMGLTRTVGAQLMEDMEVPHLNGEAPVHEKVNFRELKEELKNTGKNVVKKMAKEPELSTAEPITKRDVRKAKRAAAVRGRE